jgi:hypothetical protein
MEYQIEFRAFHIKDNCYLDGLQQVIFKNSKQRIYKACFVACNVCLYWIDGEELIFEPSTNEVDKNNKQIYLNDVVLVPEGWSGDYFYKKAFGVVKYEDHSFYIDSSNSSDYSWDKLEVIGTIHTFNEDTLKVLR